MTTLTVQQQNLVDSISHTGLLRKLMSSEEIKTANELVKLGVLYKGQSDDRQKSVCFFIW